MALRGAVPHEAHDRHAFVGHLPVGGLGHEVRGVALPLGLADPHLFRLYLLMYPEELRTSVPGFA